MNIKNVDFPIDQYYQDIFDKKQIVLHHTVSDPLSHSGDVYSWKNDKGRIATYCVIGYDGSLNKCFPSNMWAHHIGMKEVMLKQLKYDDYLTRNVLLNKHSIGIEIDCWGGLNLVDGKYINAYGREISKDLDIVKCDWRGYKYFQKYSKAQIDAIGELLTILMKEYNIPKSGIVDGNLNTRKSAIDGTPGIYSHSSYRTDKSDIYPDVDMMKMLSSL